MQSLSMELVVPIFELTTGVDEEDYHTWKSHYLQLRDLSLVSTSWKTVVDGTPWFWQYVPNDAPPSFLDNILAKSKTYPLIRVAARHPLRGRFSTRHGAVDPGMA